MNTGSCGPSSGGNRCGNASSRHCGSRQSHCAADRGGVRGGCGSRVTSSSNADVMTVTATRIHNDVSPHPHLGRQGGGGGAHHRASGSFDAQSLLAARTRDFDAMRREFQYHLNLAQEAITLADRECHEDHHGYHSQPRPTTLHQAQALDNFMQAQVLNARHKLQHANEVLHAANLHIAQLSAEAIGIDTSQKAHPGPDIHEHYQRKVFQLNLEKERLSRIAHAALAREGQLSHALLRKNEAGHILADLHHKMVEHHAAEAHRLAHVITACHVTPETSRQAEPAAGCNHTPSPAACAVSPPTAPTPSHPVQRNTALGATGSAMRPLALVAPLAAGTQGALVSTVAASAQTSVLSEVGSLALSMARMPLGIGLLAFSSKAGEGSDKVPGRENGVPAALLAQPGNDANAINYSGLGREASITREANRDVERYSSRGDVAHHAAGPQPDSDNVAVGRLNNTAAEMSRHDRQPQALSSTQANALAKSVSALADDSPPARIAKSAVKAKTRIDAKTPTHSATETVPVANDLIGGKLENPLPIKENKTVLISPDQRGEQGVRHTGNVDDSPFTVYSTTVTPVSDGPNWDDFVYLSGARDNRLPIPECTIANNGLKIESNTKHTPGAQGSRPNAGIEPRNSLELFEHSISTKDLKIRLAIDSEGNIHRFFNTSKDGKGSFHWSGSTGDEKNPLGKRELSNFNKEIKDLKAKNDNRTTF